MVTPSTKAAEPIEPAENAEQFTEGLRLELLQHQKRVKELEDENIRLREELQEATREAKNAVDIPELRGHFGAYREGEQFRQRLAQLDANLGTSPKQLEQVGKMVNEVAEDGEAQGLVKVLADEVVCYLEKLGEMIAEQKEKEKQIGGARAAGGAEGPGDVIGVKNEEHGDEVCIGGVNKDLPQKQTDGLDNSTNHDRNDGKVLSKPSGNISAVQPVHQAKEEIPTKENHNALLLPVLSRQEAANFANFIGEASKSLAEMLRGDDMATRPLGDLAIKAVALVIDMSGQFFAHTLVEMAAMVASANGETKETKEKLETVLTVLREMEVKVAAMREKLDTQNQEPAVLVEEAQFPREESDVTQEEPKDMQQGLDNPEEQADQGSKKKKKRRAKKKNANTTNELSGQSVRTSHDFEGIQGPEPQELNGTFERDLTITVPKADQSQPTDKQIEQQTKETQGTSNGWETDSSWRIFKDVEGRPRLQPKSQLKGAVFTSSSPADPTPARQVKSNLKVASAGPFGPPVDFSAPPPLMKPFFSSTIPTRDGTNEKQSRQSANTTHSFQRDPVPPLSLGLAPTRRFCFAASSVDLSPQPLSLSPPRPSETPTQVPYPQIP